MWHLIKSISFNKIISKFMWVKGPHLLHYYQIKLSEKFSTQNKVVHVYKRTQVKQQNKTKYNNMFGTSCN